MPGYISRSGLVYSEEEIKQIVRNENEARTDTRMSGVAGPLVEDHEIPQLIESHEQRQKYSD